MAKATQDILAGYALIKILISWLSLGFVQRRHFSAADIGNNGGNLPLRWWWLFWFVHLYGRLKAIAKWMCFKWYCSLLFLYINIWDWKIGGIKALAKYARNFWNLTRTCIGSGIIHGDALLLLGYPVSAVAFLYSIRAWCKVYRCQNLKQGQLGCEFYRLVKSAGIAHVYFTRHYLFCIVSKPVA